MVKAYSYLRFSTPEQAKGDSFRRQTAAAADAYALRHGLELDDSLRLRDEGVSGFHGANVRKGALGQFLRSVDDGLVPVGSYLLVENLDRVSRQNPWEALPIFQQIINAGVTIVTLQDERVYQLAEMRANPIKILESLFVMIRANEESQTKARRLSASWKNKRAVAGTKRMTSRCPAWLRPADEGQGFDLIPDRAAIVRRIYELAASGTGQHTITETLNQEKVPTFGKAKHWSRSYVVKVLSNPAAMGKLVPHTVEHSDAGKKRRVPQEPVPAYYPAAVSAELYAAINGPGSASSKRGRHAKSPVQNMLAGLAKCPLCGGAMTRVSKGASGKQGLPKLVCAKAKAGAGCEYHSVPQQDVEAAILRNAGSLCDAPSAGEELEERLRAAEAAYDGHMDSIERLVDQLEAKPSVAIRARLAELEDGLVETKANLERARAEAVAAADAVLEAGAARLQDALETEPPNPEAVNLALRRVMRSVEVDYRDGQLAFEWMNGATTFVTYDYGFKPIAAPAALEPVVKKARGPRVRGSTPKKRPTRH